MKLRLVYKNQRFTFSHSPLFCVPKHNFSPLTFSNTQKEKPSNKRTMSLKELNDKLVTEPFVAGFSASTEDAKAYAEMFGSHTAVAQWAARMASYFQGEREELAGAKPAADHKDPVKA